MGENTIALTALDDFSEATIGQDVLRYLCLPEFLGSEKDNLLYYIGKNLARKLELTSLEDVQIVFDKLKWGHLDLIKNKRKKITFHLMSDEVVQRLQASIPTDFRLEAGFLSEAIQKVTERPCEVSEKVQEKIYRIDFTVHFLD